MTKIGIITAMQEEANHIINLLNLTKTSQYKNISLYSNDKYVLVLTGIGKIQSSIGTSILFSNFQIEKLINIGIAGSLKGQNANVGDVFLVNKISQHDMYLPFEGSHLDYAKKDILIENNVNISSEGFNFNIINNSHTLTGDQFIDDHSKVLELVNKYSADIVEMESFAIASVAREFNSLNKCIFVKAISDGADNDAREVHMSNLDFAMQNSIKVFEKLI